MSSCFVNKGLMFTYYEFCGSARPVVMSSWRAIVQRGFIERTGTSLSIQAFINHFTSCGLMHAYAYMYVRFIKNFYQ